MLAGYVIIVGQVMALGIGGASEGGDGGRRMVAKSFNACKVFFERDLGRPRSSSAI